MTPAPFVSNDNNQDPHWVLCEVTTVTQQLNKQSMGRFPSPEQAFAYLKFLGFSWDAEWVEEDPRNPRHFDVAATRNGGVLYLFTIEPEVPRR